MGVSVRFDAEPHAAPRHHDAIIALLNSAAELAVGAPRLFDCSTVSSVGSNWAIIYPLQCLALLLCQIHVNLLVRTPTGVNDVIRTVTALDGGFNTVLFLLRDARTVKAPIPVFVADRLMAIVLFHDDASMKKRMARQRYAVAAKANNAACPICRLRSLR